MLPNYILAGFCLISHPYMYTQAVLVNGCKLGLGFCWVLYCEFNVNLLEFFVYLLLDLHLHQ